MVVYPGEPLQEEHLVTFVESHSGLPQCNGVGGGLRGCLKFAQIVKFSTLEGPWSLFLQTGHFF